MPVGTSYKSNKAIKLIIFIIIIKIAFNVLQYGFKYLTLQQ